MATIRIRNNGSVDSPSAGLSVSGGETAEWVSAGGPFTVLFGPETPFRAGDTFAVPAGGSVPSGPLKAGVRAGEVYPYIVRRAGSGNAPDPGAGKGAMADPEVKIDP